MITIEQLLESVDLDFEPRWVTKDESGAITFHGYETKPRKLDKCWSIKDDFYEVDECIKVANFENKPWQECIYEVPCRVDYTKWFGKLCRFWDGGASDDDTQTMVRLTYGILTAITNGDITPFECDNIYEFEHCEPVRPDDDVIYQGE